MSSQPPHATFLIVLGSSKSLNPNGTVTASHGQNPMNKLILLCICSIALPGNYLFAQVTTETPIASPTTAATATATPTFTATAAPSATASSVSSDLADKIQRKLEKKLGGKHGIIIEGGDEDRDLGKSHEDIPAFVIPIVAITLLTVFGAPVLIVGLIMYFSFSRSRALQKTVRMMVEKGQPVPEALLNPPTAQRQRSDLRRGVVLAMIGIGLMVFFGAVNDWEGGAWTLGLIPFLIGAGYLLVWKLDTKKDNPPRVP
jgi:hypothetical protein